MLDFTTWAINLTAANSIGSSEDPVWFELYHAKNEYDLVDLSPDSMNKFFHRMLVDDILFEKYFKYTLFVTMLEYYYYCLLCMKINPICVLFALQELLQRCRWKNFSRLPRRLSSCITLFYRNNGYRRSESLCPNCKTSVYT